MIELEIYGIKCDSCTYSDMNVKYEDYPNYLNKPCPDCGANLLTEKDYKDCLKMSRAVNRINRVEKIVSTIFNPKKWFK